MAANAAKKKRPEEEVEEEMHLAFRGAANALSQVYTHAVAHQKASFIAGERRAMENAYRWLSSQDEAASEMPVAAVLAYLQNEIENRTEAPPASPQHPGPQPASKFPLESFEPVFRVLSHELIAQRKWATEQPFVAKSGLHSLQSK
ncbi:unnamed protein product [Urochloa humidicola]